MKRGQGSTEMMVILGISIIVIGVLIVNSQTSLFSAKWKYQENQAKIVIEDIRNSAEHVYQQGFGAKTRVFVTIPKNVAYSNLTTNYISITFDNGNSIARSFDFNITGSVPFNEGGYYIEVESRGDFVLIGMNVSSTAYCGDEICNIGENCPGDADYCTDNICYEPNCVNGCGETGITNEVDTGECDYYTTAGSCTSAPCYCDASSICMDVMDTTKPIVMLIEPLNGTTNTTANYIDFTFNVTDDGNIANCSLFIDSILNKTSFNVQKNLTQNITTYLTKGTYSWFVNCTDDDVNEGYSGTRTLNVKRKNYFRLCSENWPITFDTALNYSGNTFWNARADDCWDWVSDSYMGHSSSFDTCVEFNYGSVDTDKKLEINVGDEGCGSGDDNGQGSGAYGIKFYVSSETYDLISAGGLTNLSFDWAYTAMSNELDSSNDMWIKATFGNGTIWGYEDFESRELGSSYTWNGGSGWLNEWYETGAGSRDGNSDEYSGKYSMRLTGGYVWTDRDLNLSESTKPYIKFYAKANSLENAENIEFQVSNNDSTWYTLQSWVDGNDDDTWKEYNFDLSPYFYNSDDFWIAFESDFGSNDYFYVDQIVIYDGNTTYLGTNLDGSANEGDVWNELYWESNPGASAGQFASFNISNMIKYPGWYYLALGGQVYLWNNANEGANFYFDNLTFYVEE